MLPQNEFFSGPEFVDVPPGGKTAYTITYRPLTMTGPENPHEGSVFFPIPDGSGQLHRLLGRATAPVAEAKASALPLSCVRACVPVRGWEGGCGSVRAFAYVWICACFCLRVDLCVLLLTCGSVCAFACVWVCVCLCLRALTSVGTYYVQITFAFAHYVQKGVHVCNCF